MSATTEQLLATLGVWNVALLAVTLDDGTPGWEARLRVPGHLTNVGYATTIDAAIRDAIAYTQEGDEA